MTHPSKRKGNAAERELVAYCIAGGIPAERAYGSNGRALGETESVDVKAAGQRIQVKRRAKLPNYMQVPAGCDAVAFREDRGAWYVMVPLAVWIAEHGPPPPD